ncbi:MAG: hypothetical protein ACOY94_18370 [Bacillota bacterium]
MTALWQRPASLLLALLLLAGCSKPPAAPQSPEPAPPPAVTAVAPGAGDLVEGEGCTPQAGAPPSGGAGSASVREGICQAYLQTDPALITFRLPPSVSELTARASLRIEGAGAERITFREGRDEGYLTVHLPAGKVGDELTIRLDGPLGPTGGPHTLGFRLKRIETPRIITEVRDQAGVWQKLTPGATLPRRELQLRLTLVGGPKRERVEFAVKEALHHRGAPSSHSLVWEGEERLLVTVPEPPPAILFRFDWLEAKHGLQVRRSTIAFYTGEAPPRLVALDPATGKETVVGEAPVDVLRASLSPDARWAYLAATDPTTTEREQVWVVDTESGERWLTPFTADWAHSQVHWLDNLMLLPTTGALQVWDLNAREGRRHESQTWFWGPLSPDRQYLAGSLVDLRRADESTLVAPASIVLFSLEKMAERLYTDAARVKLSQSSKPIYIPMRWADDGQTLLFEDVVSRDPKSFEATTRWLALDVGSWQVSDAALPAVRKEPPPAWPRAASGWSYRPAHDWGEVKLLSPQGVDHAAGQGLVLGWRADGQLLLIRWENFAYLRRTEGI